MCLEVHQMDILTKRGPTTRSTALHPPEDLAMAGFSNCRRSSLTISRLPFFTVTSPEPCLRLKAWCNRSRYLASVGNGWPHTSSRLPEGNKKKIINTYTNNRETLMDHDVGSHDANHRPSRANTGLWTTSPSHYYQLDPWHQPHDDTSFAMTPAFAMTPSKRTHQICTSL